MSRLRGAAPGGARGSARAPIPSRACIGPQAADVTGDEDAKSYASAWRCAWMHAVP